MSGEVASRRLETIDRRTDITSTLQNKPLHDIEVTLTTRLVEWCPSLYNVCTDICPTLQHEPLQDIKVTVHTLGGEGSRPHCLHQHHWWIAFPL